MDDGLRVPRMETDCRSASVSTLQCCQHHVSLSLLSLAVRIRAVRCETVTPPAGKHKGETPRQAMITSRTAHRAAEQIGQYRTKPRGASVTPLDLELVPVLPVERSSTGRSAEETAVWCFFLQQELVHSQAEGGARGASCRPDCRATEHCSCQWQAIWTQRAFSGCFGWLMIRRSGTQQRPVYPRWLPKLKVRDGQMSSLAR